MYLNNYVNNSIIHNLIIFEDHTTPLFKGYKIKQSLLLAEDIYNETSNLNCVSYIEFEWIP